VKTRFRHPCGGKVSFRPRSRSAACVPAKRIKPKDLAIFTRQLATMMKAGVPLLQSFDIVGRGNANASVTKLLNDIRTDVETGTH
jgi:type II secretory pathway component PulF